MARQPGSANFSGTIEALAGGPLDARSIVQTKADLTASGSFPYPYIGMETYVISEGKKYRLIGADTTDLNNWEEVGKPDVDDQIDNTSENPVQNKVIAEALNGKADLDDDDKVDASQLREREMHQADYDALTDAEKMNGDTYYIDDSIDEGAATAVCGFTPIGTIIPVMGTVAPRNYIACNGQVANIDTYPELAAYFEEQFGSKNKFGGDGVTTFGIPDLRGEFLRGTGTNSHANQGNGAAVGTHQDGTELPDVYGAVTANNELQISIRLDPDSAVGEFNVPNKVDGAISSNKYSLYSYNTSAKGTSTTTKRYRYITRPTNTSVLYCIAVRNIYVDARYDYSTDEKVVGTWIDGKPIYQKTVPVNITVSVDEESITSYTLVSDLNIDNVVDMKGMLFQGTSTSSNQTPITFSSWANAEEKIKYIIQPWYNQAENKVCVDCNRKWYDGKVAYVTIQYTKATD